MQGVWRTDSPQGIASYRTGAGASAPAGIFMPFTPSFAATRFIGSPDGISAESMCPKCECSCRDCVECCANDVCKIFACCAVVCPQKTYQKACITTAVLIGVGLLVAAEILPNRHDEQTGDVTNWDQALLVTGILLPVIAVIACVCLKAFQRQNMASEKNRLIRV